MCQCVLGINLGPRCARSPRPAGAVPASRPHRGLPPDPPHIAQHGRQELSKSVGPPAVAPTIRAGQGPYESSELGYGFLFLSLSQGIKATSKARGLRLCRMVRVGESRQSFPLPGEPSLGPCLSLPDGAERSLAGHISGPLCAYRFRYGPTPHPRPAFALGSRYRGISFYRLTHNVSNRA